MDLGVRCKQVSNERIASCGLFFSFFFPLRALQIDGLFIEKCPLFFLNRLSIFQGAEMSGLKNTESRRERRIQEGQSRVRYH